MMHGEPLMTRGSPCIMGNGWHSQTLKLDAAYLSLIQSSNLPLFSGVAGNGNWSGGSGGAARGGQHRKRAGCDCSCPDRELPPDPPDKLPFPATPENRGRLEDWMRDRYAASSFNVCECQPLPMMHGEPLVIRVKEGTQPKASH